MMATHLTKAAKGTNPQRKRTRKHIEVSFANRCDFIAGNGNHADDGKQVNDATSTRGNEPTQEESRHLRSKRIGMSVEDLCTVPDPPCRV